MNIYKDFLSPNDFSQLANLLLGTHTPWYFNDKINAPDDGFFQLTYLFVNNSRINCQERSMVVLQPILSKLKYKKLIRIKANLLIQTPKIQEHHFHIDQESGRTGIFYINDNNGYTKFEDGSKVKSEKNKYVEFDSKLKHTGTTCTDAKRRVVINFNYQ